MATDSHHDAVIVGGGHNGLVAAAYLARAGRSVLVLERRDHVGGAAVSERPWPGVDARLSRYAYLVSLLPQSIVDELGLRITLGRRRISSYTPLPADPSRGLLVDARGPRAHGGVAARRHRRPRGDRGLGAAVRSVRGGRPRALPHHDRAAAPGERAARAGGRRRRVGRACSSARSASSSRTASTTTPCAGSRSPTRSSARSPAPTTSTCARTAASSTTSSATAPATGTCPWAGWAR